MGTRFVNAPDEMEIETHGILTRGAPEPESRDDDFGWPSRAPTLLLAPCDKCNSENTTTLTAIHPPSPAHHRTEKLNVTLNQYCVRWLMRIGIITERIPWAMISRYDNDRKDGNGDCRTGQSAAEELF